MRNHPKAIGLVFGPLVFASLWAIPTPLLSPMGDKVLAVAAWMLIWWITEAVSISVTALLPLLLFPLLKIMPMAEVGANYGSPIVFLFFGGFVLALALEKVELHKRIALNIIHRTGTSPNRVILGFMLATASLSMWISNTASTVVMLPIALSVIQLLLKDADGFTKQDQSFALSVMLGIAIAANVGGVATVIGTPPNSVLIGLLENEYQIEISFLNWMALGLPFAAVMIGLSYLILVYLMFPIQGLEFGASQELIAGELQKLGPLSKREKHVLYIFGTTVFLWIFRTAINNLFPHLGLSDPLISVGAAISLFALPYQIRPNKYILTWEDTSKLAWGILILFGGGLALAKGMSASGIVDQVAQAIAQGNYGNFSTVCLLIGLMLFLTELMSNVALVAVLAPVVAGIALGLEIPLLHLLIPVTIASSCAFMMPMATPPNAIVFASGYVKIPQMARVGIVLNLLAVLILIGVYVFLMPLLF